MGLLVLHYETGSQWAWYNMKLVHNRPVTVLVLHYETGSQQAWYTMRLVHSGPGTPEIGSHCVMRLVHEIGSHCVMRRVHSGPGTI